MQPKCSKIVLKIAQNCNNKTWKFSVFALYGSFWGYLFPLNILISFWKTCCWPSLIIWSVWKLLSHQKFLISNNHSLSQNRNWQKFRLFWIFAGSFEPFSNQSPQIFLWKSSELWVLCWTIANILTPKRYKKYTSYTKTRLLKIFDSFGVSLRYFWSETLLRSLQKT